VSRVYVKRFDEVSLSFSKRTDGGRFSFDRVEVGAAYGFGDNYQRVMGKLKIRF
jgi:hypothetical protein